jgi:hypothetical protein
VQNPGVPILTHFHASKPNSTAFPIPGQSSRTMNDRRMQPKGCDCMANTKEKETKSKNGLLLDARSEQTM